MTLWMICKVLLYSLKYAQLHGFICGQCRMKSRIKKRRQIQLCIFLCLTATSITWCHGACAIIASALSSSYYSLRTVTLILVIVTSTTTVMAKQGWISQPKNLMLLEFVQWPDSTFVLCCRGWQKLLHVSVLHTGLRSPESTRSVFLTMSQPAALPYTGV